jgi:hypothetical protein
MDVLLAAYEAVLKGKFTKHLFNGHLVLVYPVRWMFDLFLQCINLGLQLFRECLG